MSTIVLKDSNEDLNRIESFVEHICEGFNISDTFLGNMIIAITELLNIIETNNQDIKINFKNEENKFLFIFMNFSDSVDLNLFSIEGEIPTETNAEKDNSLFMINALCDDLIINLKERNITMTFIKEGVDAILSSHRKNYLNKYLHQQIKVN